MAFSSDVTCNVFSFHCNVYHMLKCQQVLLSIDYRLCVLQCVSYVKMPASAVVYRLCIAMFSIFLSTVFGRMNKFYRI
jgi:hypothetical protein